MNEHEIVKKFFSKINETSTKAGVEYTISTIASEGGYEQIFVSKSYFDDEGELLDSEDVILILPEFKILIANLSGFSLQFNYSNEKQLESILSKLIYYL